MLRAAYSSGALGQWVLAALLVLFCACDFYLHTVAILKFQHIYEDALPGVDLPQITSYYLNFRALNAVLDIFWLAGGLYTLKNFRREWLFVFFTAMFIQMGVTFIALAMPMVGLNGGVSNA